MISHDRSEILFFSFSFIPFFRRREKGKTKSTFVGELYVSVGISMGEGRGRKGTQGARVI